VEGEERWVTKGRRGWEEIKGYMSIRLTADHPVL
jgi:hypothetical protein